MDSGEAPNDRDRAIQALVDDFCDEWFAGRPPSIDEFCRSHSEFGTELRSRIEAFLFVAEALPESEARGTEAQPGEGPDAAGRTLGEFRILRVIGSGGMATVYEAEQVSLRRKVALKVLPSHLSLSDKAVRSFQREAEAGGRQTHAGIVAVHGVGVHEGVHYIAQELVEGGRTLAWMIDEMRRAEALPIGYFRRAANLIAEVAGALGDAHGKGVIHRDVKPSNILLTKKGEPKVTDFGLARVEDALSLSRTGDFAGTPYYMSPEQALSRRMGIDHRTDVYSLGATLYEMLTLQKPFDGDTSHEIIKKIVLHDPQDPKRVNPRVPHDLAVICLKAMEKDPAHRYPTMEEMAADLRRFLHGEVIHAVPAGRATRVWRRVRRNPVVSSAVAVAGLAVITLLAYGLWSYPMILRERDRAIEARNEADIARRNAVRATAEAERQRDRAERNFNRACDAVDQLLTRVAEERLLNVPQMEGLRRDLLERALAFFEEFLAERDDDPYVKREAAQAHYRVGRIRAYLGEVEPAERSLTRSATLYEELGRESPDDDCLHELTEVHMRRASLLREMKRNQEALEEIEKAEGTVRTRLEEAPANRRNLRDLFAVRMTGGAILERLGRTEEAERSYREALEFARGVVKREPDGREGRQDLARVLVNLGTVAHRSRGPQESAALFAEAAEIFRGLLRERPDDENIRADRAIALENGARAKAAAGSFDESEASYREALAAWRELAEDYPSVLDHIRSVGSVELEIGILAARDGRLREAEERFRDALPPLEDLVRRQPHVEGYTSVFTRGVHSLASLFESTDRVSERIELYEKEIAVLRPLADRWPDHPHLRSALATLLHNLGKSRFDRGETAVAESLFEEAAIHQRAALEAAPEDERCRRFLRLHAMSLALTRIDLGDAEGVAAAAVELAEVASDEVRDRWLAMKYLRTAVELPAESGESESARSERARSWENRSIEIGRGTLEIPVPETGGGPPPRDLLLCRLELGRLLTKHGSFEEAERHLIAARDAIEATHGPDDEDAVRARQLLADLEAAKGTQQ